MWLILKFFLLATELSVIVFGFMFGESVHLTLCCVTSFVLLSSSSGISLVLNQVEVPFFCQP